MVPGKPWFVSFNLKRVVTLKTLVGKNINFNSYATEHDKILINRNHIHKLFSFPLF